MMGNGIGSGSYDPASQVTNILHQLTASSTQINKADYLYNGVGNRTSLTGPEEVRRSATTTSIA
ncbi:MAG: hypothetical protein IPM88_12700 [Nitrospira sp.]|nr:hypothetical protein [Nitrospira sp.]